MEKIIMSIVLATVVGVSHGAKKTNRFLYMEDLTKALNDIQEKEDEKEQRLSRLERIHNVFSIRDLNNAVKRDCDKLTDETQINLFILKYIGTKKLFFKNIQNLYLLLDNPEVREKIDNKTLNTIVYSSTTFLSSRYVTENIHLISKISSFFRLTPKNIQLIDKAFSEIVPKAHKIKAPFGHCCVEFAIEHMMSSCIKLKFMNHFSDLLECKPLREKIFTDHHYNNLSAVTPISPDCFKDKTCFFGSKVLKECLISHNKPFLDKLKSYPELHEKIMLRLKNNFK